MGMTTDIFCSSSTLLHSLESLLLLQLRELGFRRIVYYSASKKLHWLDNGTAELCSPTQRANRNAQSGSAVRDIRPGPLGSGLLKRPLASNTAVAAQTQEGAVRWHFGAMTDVEVVNTAKTWLLDRQLPTALIVRDTADLLTHFDRDAQRQMNEMFLDMQRAGTPGFCVLVFPQYHSTQMLIGNKETWGNLVSPMLTRSQDGAFLSSSVLVIGSPDEREVANALVEEGGQGLNDKKAILDKAAQLARRARFDYAKDNAQASLVGGLHYLSLHNWEVTMIPMTSAMERLEGMTGMAPIAAKLRGMVLLAKEEQSRSKSSSSPKPEGNVDVGRLNIREARPEGKINLHLALMGNPGTGKTHVARLIAEIYREEGLLETGHLVEVTRKDLVAGYVGQTAINTGAAIERAMGGVLFIDEAYQLSEGGEHDFGKEAIETVMKAMSDFNGHFAVIVAGYPRLIQDFILGTKANPGLARRFPEQNRLVFADYTPEQLHDIFSKYTVKQELALAKDLQEVLPNFFVNWYRARDPERFGNAGEVINLISTMDQLRILREGVNGPRTLQREDVPEGLRMHVPVQAASDCHDAME